MTPQDIIKNFMRSLDKHSFKTANVFNEEEKKALVKRILDQSIAKNSQFKSIEDLVNNIVNDCRTYINNDKTYGYKNFLKEKCGIDLYNIDTGAISGSDANIIVDSNSIGSGIEKSDVNIVPEYGNYYEAVTIFSQNIKTGDNGWIVKCGLGNDTIISNGEDSICTFEGTNYITLSGSNATVDTRNSKTNIFISNNVKSVILIGYDKDKDVLKGNTEIVTFKDTGEGIFTNIKDATLTSADTNIKNIGMDNYFNIDGCNVYNESGIINVDLNKAINENNPKPVGAFIINNNTEADFVYTNEDCKKGKLVGHIASIYPQLMEFSYMGLKLRVKNRILINGNTSAVLKTFSIFNDIGSDTDYTFQNTYKNKTTVPEFTDSDTGNEYEKYIVASIYKWWFKEGLKLAKLNYDISFEDDDATILNIDLTFKKTIGGSNALASVSWSFRSDGITVGLVLNVNKDFYEDLTDFSDINGGSKNSVVYLDRTICHEFTHAVMAAKIKYFSYLPRFISEGTAELAHGIDDKRTYSIIMLAANPDLLEESLLLTDEYGTADYQYSGGYIFFRYLAKQAALYSQNSLLPIQVHPIINLKDNVNTTYYIKNLSIKDPDAITSDGEYSVGSAQDNTYILSDNFEQIINTGKNTWNICLNTINNTIKSIYGNDNITIDGGDNQYIDFDSGNNNIVINSGNNHTINCYEGTNNINLIPKETIKNNNIYLGNGNGNVTLCGENNILNTESGINEIKLYGKNNTIKSGDGNDTIIQYSNSAGHNIYLFDSETNFGTNLIQNFMSNDIINISEKYDINISNIKTVTYMDNNNNSLGNGQILTIDIENKNTKIGSVEIRTNTGGIFNENVNIIHSISNNNQKPEEYIEKFSAYDEHNTKRNNIKNIEYKFDTEITYVVKEKIKVSKEYNTKRNNIKNIEYKFDTEITYVAKEKIKVSKEYNTKRNNIKNIEYKFDTNININLSYKFNTKRNVQKSIIKKYRLRRIYTKDGIITFFNTLKREIINVIIENNVQRCIRGYKKPVIAFIIDQKYKLINNNELPYSEFRKNIMDNN